MKSRMAVIAPLAMLVLGLAGPAAAEPDQEGGYRVDWQQPGLDSDVQRDRGAEREQSTERRERQQEWRAERHEEWRKNREDNWNDWFERRDDRSKRR